MDLLCEGMCFKEDGRGGGAFSDLTPHCRIVLTKMEDYRERVTAG